MADIVITEFMDAPAIEGLKRDFSVLFDPDLWGRKADLEAAVAGARALIVRNRSKVDEALIDAGKRLEVIGRLGVGLDNIDVAHARSKGVKVEAAVGANADSVAEYVVCTAMLLLRGAAYTSSARLAAGEWPREALGKGRELAGKTLGIVGFGSIGQRVGRLARLLGMEIVAHDDFVPAGHAAWQEARRVSLDELIAASDVVSLHCPLTPGTRNLLDAGRLARLRKGVVLVNAARGGVVDEAALAAALKSGHVGGAAIDVFDVEPIEKQAGALFAGLANVILTPHIAGVTVEANTRTSDVTAANVRRVLEGRA